MKNPQHKCSGWLAQQLRENGAVIAKDRGVANQWAGPIYLADPPEAKQKTMPGSRRDYLRAVKDMAKRDIKVQSYLTASLCLNAKVCERSEEDAFVAFVGHTCYIKYPEEGVTWRWYLTAETKALQDGFDRGVKPPARFDVVFRAARGSERLNARREKEARRVTGKKARGESPRSYHKRDPKRSPKKPTYDATVRNGVLIARERSIAA